MPHGSRNLLKIHVRSIHNSWLLLTLARDKKNKLLFCSINLNRCRNSMEYIGLLFFPRNNRLNSLRIPMESGSALKQELITFLRHSFEIPMIFSSQDYHRNNALILATFKFQTCERRLLSKVKSHNLWSCGKSCSFCFTSIKTSLIFAPIWWQIRGRRSDKLLNFEFETRMPEWRTLI